MPKDNQPITVMPTKSYWLSEWLNPGDAHASIKYMKEVGVPYQYLWPPELGGHPDGRVMAGNVFIQRMLEAFLCQRLNVSSGLYKDAITAFLFELRNPVTGFALVGEERFMVQYEILREFYAKSMHLDVKTSGYNSAMPYEGRGL